MVTPAHYFVVDAGPGSSNTLNLGGLPGARLTDRVPYFVSGIAYPDLTILDSSSLSKGVEGLRGAAFFGNDWSLETGEVALRP